MQITLTEALRLKSEISTVVRNLSRQINSASLGVTEENGVIISRNDVIFADVEDALIKGLNYSEELNNSISSFNKDNKVDAIVRKLQNAKLLLDIYTINLPRTKPTKQNRFESFSTERKVVEIVYTPSMSSKDMKEKILSQKAITRELQTQVEKLNQQEIEVSFTYEDIEALSN